MTKPAMTQPPALPVRLRRLLLVPAWLAALPGLLPLPAAAQVLLPPVQSRSWVGLTPQDIDLVHQAETRFFQDQAIGTVERWRNPQSGNAGEVTLARTYESKGAPCHSLSYTLRFAKPSSMPDKYTLDWCQQPDGAWKIVSLGGSKP